MEEKAQGLKVDGTIRKPIDLDELYATIDRICGTQRATSALVKPAHEPAQQPLRCAPDTGTSAERPTIG